MSILQSEVVVKKKKKKNEAESRQLQWNWSSLPDDLLRLIFERLNWVDRLRFCLVSKNYPSLLQRIPCRPADKLPWLLFINSGGPFLVRCNVSEPFSKLSKFTYDVRIMDEEARTYLRYATPFTSSNGWVLMFWRVYGNEGRIDRVCHYFSLYRPYNNKFVKLPKLEVCRDFVSGRATISVDHQTSLLSVFYACLDRRTPRTVNIWMCHIGATNWKNLKFQLPADGTEVKTLDDALYADGFVYCFFDDGCKIVIFDVVLQDWKFFSYNFIHQKGYLIRRRYAVYNGDLLMLHTYGGSPGCLSFSWIFDKSLKQWVQQEHLGDLALFVGASSMFPVKAVGELSCYANTLHFLEKSGTSYKWRSTGKSKFSELYHVPDDYKFHWRSYYWIEPPNFTQN